eukprot:1190267-Prorocentrum_minimum.AAC.2
MARMISALAIKYGYTQENGDRVMENAVTATAVFVNCQLSTVEGTGWPAASTAISSRRTRTCVKSGVPTSGAQRCVRPRRELGLERPGREVEDIVGSLRGLLAALGRARHHSGRAARPRAVS